MIKSFITRVENLIDQRVKVIRCDNGTEFKNKEMNQFCERKGIKREFSVARTPQQNGVAERKNRTLIEAARTMLADSKLPTTFWAEAVNTACYVQNRVLVTKPHNKTPYELFLGRKLALGFMRPFGCPVTILNTIDHLGKFDGKADKGFFVGYSINSKTFRVFNSRTRIVEENLHVQFYENTPNIAGSGPNWLLNIDALTKSMNYKPVVAGNQSNGNAGTKACNDTGKARMETVPDKDYILLPLWTSDPRFSQSSKSSPDAGFQPSGDDEKKVTKEPGKEGGDLSKEVERDDQEKDASINNTNNVNAASTNEVNAVGRKASIKLPDEPNMSVLEDIVYSDNDEDVGAEADINNLDAFMPVSPIPTTIVHKDHPVEQIIRDLNLAPQIRRMTKNLEELRAFLPCYRLKEEVYVFQPPGYEDPDFPDKVYKVENALYGLHQAPKAWYETLSTYLLDNRFQKGKIDKTLFMRMDKGLPSKAEGRMEIFISRSQYVTWNFEGNLVLLWYKTAKHTYGYSKTLLKRMKDGLQALVDGKKIIVTEASVRYDLQLNDEEGTHCLPNATIFEELTRMGAKTTAWNEFSSTMASAIIYLATNQRFNFSKYIFESMVKNLENVSGKFLMYPRFVQVFLEKQLEGMSSHKRIYGEGSTMPTDTQHTPTIIQPSTSQPQRKQRPRKPKRKDTEVPQLSGPTTNVADKAVYEERDDSLVRAATTASSLEAELTMVT
ncbi:ribonuclease H-like domain-containing protein [Tanacetum coccineum]